MSVPGKVLAATTALLLVGWVSYRADLPDASCTPQGPLGERVAATAGRWVHAAANNPPPTPKEVRVEVDGALGKVTGWAHTFQAAALGKAPKVAPTASQPDGLRGAVLARAAASRYFPDNEVRTAVAVAGAESAYRPDAVNRANRNGSVDHGMWQINSVHRHLLAGRDWRDPYVNAWMAHQVWEQAGGSWSPWTTFNSGAYRKFLDGQGAEAPACSSQPTASSPSSPAPASFDQLGNPRSVEAAVAWAERMADQRTPITPRMCLHYMADAYGWGFSGVNTAYQHWLRTPARFKGTGTPPRGALVYWRTPGPGHIALSLGGGKIATTDYPKGRIGIVNIEVIDRWGPRLGWSAPVFPARTKL